MKTFFLMLALLLSESGHAECSSLVGHTVFVDLNNSEEEVVAAAKATQEKCQTFHLAKSMQETEQIFQKLETAKEGIESLIISGHAGWSGFTGHNFTSVSQGEYKKLIFMGLLLK
jgi:hypothetical protein